MSANADFVTNTTVGCYLGGFGFKFWLNTKHDKYIVQMVYMTCGNTAKVHSASF
jgi:hypothetical protein